MKRSPDGEDSHDIKMKVAASHDNHFTETDIPPVTGLSSESNSSTSQSEEEASPHTSRSPSPLAKLENGDCAVDDSLPHLDDVEAGFIPADGQPYRRIRRHTIT